MCLLSQSNSASTFRHYLTDKRNVDLIFFKQYVFLYRFRILIKSILKSIASCSIEIFRFLAISIVELKNTHFRRVLPVFWAFPVQGPIIIASRTIVREVMMGPRTGNAQKTGKTEAEMGILKLNNGNVRNLKISMLHIVL